MARSVRFGAAAVVVALVVTGCSATATSPPYTFTAPPPPVVVTPEPTTAPPAAESSLLASMTAEYDSCTLNQLPSGTLVADISCSTVDGVLVEGWQYTTSSATSAAFKAQADAKKGTRCSAGAYLGSYRVAGKTMSQLGCNGSGTIAWTVAALRLYLSATDGDLPTLYAWWQDHWTVGSSTATATTGEKPVPVPTAAPLPTLAPTPADVYPATPADTRFKQTWTKSYSTTTCGDWNNSMTPPQRWTMAADMLYGARGVTALPPDDLITTFGQAISVDCLPSGVLKVTEVAAAIYTLDPGTYGP